MAWHERSRITAWAVALLLAGCASSGDGPPSDVLNVADAAIAGGDPDMALSISQAVLNQQPENVDALYHEAAAYYALGRCEDAMAAYRVALTLAPHSATAETGVGRCLLKRNAIEAEQAFAAAVADDPDNAVALNDLGVARDLQGHFAAATAPYEQSLLVAPGMKATEVNLGLSLALAGQAAEAMDYLGPLAGGTEATARIRADYAVALVGAGRLDDARQVLSTDLPPDKVQADIDAFTTLLGHGPGDAAQAMNLFGYIPPG